MLKSPNTGSKTRLWIFYIFVILVHFLIIGGIFSGALAITPWAAAAAVRQAVE